MLGFFWQSGASEHKSSKRENERELKCDYFGHLFADYCRLPREAREDVLKDLPKSLAQLLQDFEEKGELAEALQARIDWSEIAAIEDKILARQDALTLRWRARDLRARYERLIGREAYQLYLASQPPDISQPDLSIDDLRADLRRVLSATHHGYSLTVVRENSRRRVMKSVGTWTFYLCAAVLAIGVLADAMSESTRSAVRPLLSATGADEPSEWWAAFAYPIEYATFRARLTGALVAVVLFGCLGAYLSIQRRLQQSADRGDPVISILGLYEFNCIKQFPLVAGGLFALVLYFAIAAGLLKGDLFPDLVHNGVPQALPQWGKLFIWAFLAGFAERLVPDTLDRLVNQVTPPPAAMPASSGGASGRPLTLNEIREVALRRDADDDDRALPDEEQREAQAERRRQSQDEQGREVDTQRDGRQTDVDQAEKAADQVSPGEKATG